jgi:hypothetical protein
MSDAGVSSASVSNLNRQGLRIVLFGMPDAGKSSLLGALAQAAQTQEHVLNGHLTDLSHGLADLQRRLYEEAPRETLEEVVPYAVTFDSFTSSGADANGRHLDATFIDCDGRVANELLARRRSLSAGEGVLAQQILQADALILVIDASAPLSQVESDFVEFGRFLRLLEQNRGQRSEVGGLPVYLVLAKCDLLAQAADTPAAWMDRIEDRKRDLNRRFQAFLARQSSAPVPFGSIDLHLWATAVKHPALAGSAPRPRDPFGVAELFRQCLQSALGFRRRQRRSGRRLFWTVAGTIGIVALLAGLAVNRIVDRHPTRSSALLEKITSYRAMEGETPSLRLREPLQRKISVLKEFQDDPEFAALPESDKSYVQERLLELEDYLAYWERLQHVRLGEVRTSAELARLEGRLNGGDLDVPASHRAEWGQTEAALAHAELVKDVHALRTALTEAEDWYRQLIRQAQGLGTFSRDKPTDAPSWAAWQQQIGAVVSKTFPHSETEELPGSSSLTYASLARFEELASLRRDWETVQQRLERLRDLTAALGLAGKLPDGERQPLDIPAHFSVAQAASYRERLNKIYPELSKETPAIELPDAVAADFRRTARTAYDHLIEAGRQVVLDHLPPNAHETPTAWQRVREWLAAPSELREWRALATLLARIQDPDAGDPVSSLAEFLSHDRFIVDVQQITLEIPFDRKLTPAGPFTIYHATAGAEPAPVLTLRLADDEGQRDPQRRVTVYSFLRSSGTDFVYRPGDMAYADLPVKKDGQGDWMLTWARARSEGYQFERLVRPPRLHRKAQENIEGDLLGDVSTSLLPERGVPKVPDLLPIVMSKKR